MTGTQLQVGMKLQSDMTLYGLVAQSHLVGINAKRLHKCSLFMSARQVHILYGESPEIHPVVGKIWPMTRVFVRRNLNYPSSIIIR